MFETNWTFLPIWPFEEKKKVDLFKRQEISGWCVAPALWLFFENLVQKCLGPNFAVWMILFAKAIADTLKINNWYHIFIFYVPFILSFNSKVAKILCFDCFHSFLLWSVGTKIFLKPLIVPSCAYIGIISLGLIVSKWFIVVLECHLVWKKV